MSNDKKEFTTRSGFDRRGPTDRRVLNLGFNKRSVDRRKQKERREEAERRADWKRISKWSSAEDKDVEE